MMFVLINYLYLFNLHYYKIALLFHFSHFDLCVLINKKLWKLYFFKNLWIKKNNSNWKQTVVFTALFIIKPQKILSSKKENNSL